MYDDRVRGGAEMECPKCSGEMVGVVVDDVTVDQCEGCGGMWFDLGEVASLDGRGALAALDTGDPRTGRLMNLVTKIDCPRCSIELVPLYDPRQPHIRYEACRKCHGAYFDAGEVADLADAERNLAILLSQAEW